MIEHRATVKRYVREEHQTFGVWYDRHDIPKAYTLELPWRNNQRNVSCIPDGEYLVSKHLSPKHGQCFWLKNTFPRTEILVHAGNYNNDTQGCILVGNNISDDINADGCKDLTGSRDALHKLLRILPKEFKLIIETEGNGVVQNLPAIS